MGDFRIEKQLALEEEAIQLGIDAYRKAVREDDLADTDVGIRLMKRCMIPLMAALKEFKSDSNIYGRLKDVKKFFHRFKNEEIAYITTKAVLNSMSGAEPVQRVAIKIAGMLKDHLEYENFKEQHPNYLAVVERNLKTDHIGHKRAVIMRAKNKLMDEAAHWSEVDRLHIGMKCIELMIESTGIIEKEQSLFAGIAKGDKFNSFRLVAVPEVMEWIEKAHEKCELLNPHYLPMVMSPKRWESVFGGGFYTNEYTNTFKLVKTRDSEGLYELNDVEMPEVYYAINRVQETPWRINKKVYGVMKEIWQSGSSLGDVPVQDDEPLPARPWDSDEEFEMLKKENIQVIKDWKLAATKAYEKRIVLRSKRLAMAQKIFIADKFVDEPEIYFVWVMDWRGRMYPVQPYVNPQADDTGKGLLEFARGVKLGERGLYWLKVHAANCYGYDKVSFDERVKWVDEHMEHIYDSADNPLDGLRFWCEADSPFQFLAVCFELRQAKDKGIETESFMPVAMDGSCNGLQNFSAMLRDEVGGAAVNLIPSDTPKDIYGIVAEVVSKEVVKDAAEGNELAQLWVGKIDRKIAKRNVMTFPYGAKQYGFKGQLLAELKDRSTPEQNYLNVKDNFAPANYLAAKMYTGIGSVVIAAANAMKWLQEVSKIVTKADKAIRWTTPIGFQAKQLYLKQDILRVATFWGDIRLQLSLNVDSNKLNKMKMANGISPNFVHSLDASHLMKTINRSYEMGIRAFSMVHDSYGTHAANIDKLARYLRETFVEQYSQDVLENFKKEVEQQLPEELAAQIPVLPAKGSLDLEAVKDSQYFFA